MDVDVTHQHSDSFIASILAAGFNFAAVIFISAFNPSEFPTSLPRVKTSIASQIFFVAVRTVERTTRYSLPSL